MKGIFHMLGVNLQDRQASETESEQPESDELIPDDYIDPTGDTVPLLKIVKDDPQSSDRSKGVDPYNTDRFQASKEWLKGKGRYDG